ncbi:MAG TPA: hypothetical protein VFG20_11245 [Planctomycetaceae bacterium]|jgi:hypothetical protein|nr:hypothetical protein [Planctomycetaceae bacterium]
MRVARLLVLGLLCLGACLQQAPCHAAEDELQPNSRWVGSIKTANPEGRGKKKRVKLTSSEMVLIIKTREGKEFTGESHKDKGQRVHKIAGTINEKGIADWRVTERGKGATADDVVDNARIHGTFKNGEFKGYFIVPGNDTRGGEIELKLVKPEDKNAKP